MAESGYIDITECAGGKIYYYNDYDVYIPDECNSNTNFHIYAHGGSPINADNSLWNDAEGIREYLKNNTPNDIVIMPATYNNSNPDEYGANVSNIVSNIAEKYNIDNPTIVSSGFSGGCNLGVQTSTYINENTNFHSNVAISIDYTEPDCNDVKLTSTQIESMKRNNVTLIAFQKNGYVSETYTNLAKEGVNVLVINDNGDERGIWHGRVNGNAYNNGIIAFASGETDQLINAEQYTFKSFNGEEWVEDDNIYNLTSHIDDYTYTSGIDYQISSNFDDLTSSIQNLKNIDNVITSDNEFVATNMNNIRAKIKGTNILDNLTNPSIESTTHVPAQTIDILYQYSSSVITLMDKLVKETTSIANIGIAIDNQDKELETETEEIIDTQPTEEVSPNKEPTPTPSPIIPPVKDTQPNKKDNISEDKKAEENIAKNETQNNKPVSNNTSQNNSQTTSQNHQYKPSSSNQNNTSNNNQNNTSNNQTPSVQNNSPKAEETPSNPDFPKYEEIYSNDNQIVYNYNDECKLIIHHEGDQITGIEYYYDLGSKENAFNMFDEINNKYSSIEGFQEVIQNDRYVKVVLSNDYASQFNINDIKNKFSNLQEIIK